MAGRALMTVVANAGETLDALLWRVLGRTDVLAAALEFNPGLAALGVALPEGAPVRIPPLPAEAAEPADLVQLWD